MASALDGARSVTHLHEVVFTAPRIGYLVQFAVEPWEKLLDGKADYSGEILAALAWFRSDARLVLT